MRYKSIVVGTVTGLLMFGAANSLSYYAMRNEPVLIDANVGFGFPFRLFASSGFAGDSIIWWSLILDVLIAISTGIILGLAAESLLRTYRARRQRL